jgi:hypothetical protein
MKNLGRLPEPHRSLYTGYRAYSQAVDLALPSLVRAPLFYDPVHRAFRRTDRRYTTMVKATADLEKKAEEAPDEATLRREFGLQPRKKHRWLRPNRPLAPDLTWNLRASLARVIFWGEDSFEAKVTRNEFCRALLEVEQELLGGDDSAVGLMLAGRLVTAWAMTLWADAEVMDRPHEMSCSFPSGLRAKAAVAEAMGRQFQAALRAWESYCMRSLGLVPGLPESSRNRIAQFFNSAASPGGN